MTLMILKFRRLLGEADSVFDRFGIGAIVNDDAVGHEQGDAAITMPPLHGN